MVWVELIVLGAGVGLLSTFLGLGGGAIMVPALVWLGLSQQESVATSLLTIFLIAIMNVRAFARKGYIPWAKTVYLLAASGVTAFIAARIAVGVSEFAVKFVFAIVLLAVLALTLIRRSSARSGPPLDGKWAFFNLGIFTGTLSGMTGLGGGAVAGPLLIRLKMAPGVSVVPIINVMLLFTSVLGVIGYWLSQQPHWQFSIVLFAAAQLTSPIGHAYQHKFSDKARYKLLLGILLVVTVQVWWDLYVHGR